MSSIGKALELKIGEENVKNIPMSAMQRYFTYANDLDVYESVTEDFALAKGFEQFKKYLASIGLTKEFSFGAFCLQRVCDGFVC